jgi:hypothetical protein
VSGTTPPPDGIVVFDYATWVLRFPEFAAVTPALAALYFAEAEQLLDNTACSPVSNMTQRTVLLNLLTAHIAKLNATTASGQSAGGGLVGPITSASEGSVSVSTSIPLSPGSSQVWYAQTPYGMTYWAMTASFRQARYYPRLWQPFRQVPGPFSAAPWGRGY